MSETEERAEEFHEATTVAVLWFAVLAGPIAWTLGLNADYALVRIACTEQTMLPLHLVTLVTLPLAAAGGVVAWRAWGRAGFRWPHVKPGDELTRTRFMMALGLLGSAFFSLVIVVQWMAKLFLNPCMGI